MSRPIPKALRLCVACVHFYVISGNPGYSEMTPGWDVDMGCGKRHWKLDTYNDTTKTYQKKMASAVKCKDFLQVKGEQ